MPVDEEETAQREAMHDPVMVDEVLDHLAVRPGGCYLDGTAGAGGHVSAILDACAPDGTVFAIDRDREAVRRVRRRLASSLERLHVVQGNFADMEALAASSGLGLADGIVLDLGLSTNQLDAPERGFSFSADGPLDMRMDNGAGATAADLVNQWDEEELTEMIRNYGEERRARSVARAIVAARKRAAIVTTHALADIVSGAVGGRRGRLHPATRTFQAIRIAVNRELESLRQGLDAALRLLAPRGRLAVLSFHSLEDRIVKHCFAGHAGRWESLPEGGRAWRGMEPAVTRITRKPLTATPAEVSRNPRSRSAKLRVVERSEPPIGGSSREA